MRILTIAVLVTLSGSIALAQQLSPQPGSASASQMPVTSGQTPAAQTSAAANPSTAGGQRCARSEFDAGFDDDRSDGSGRKEGCRCEGCHGNGFDG